MQEQEIINTTYNGWSNRETWLVSLWLNNNEYSYLLLNDILRLNISNSSKAHKLQELVDNQLDDLELGASLFSDLLSTALAKVNWLEVVKSNQE